LQKHNELARE